MTALDKKYRPKLFSRVIGNAIVVRRLKSLLKDKETFPSTILLQGPSGCGKTTIARIVAKKLKISEVWELNIANQRKIDDARNIISNIQYSSMASTQGKVFILNECHKANNEFQNAMLESLEEPPPGVHFILCTTEPNKILATIKTRADIFQVKRLGRIELTELVKSVTSREKLSLTKNSIRNVVSAADGSPRNALVLLNSVKDIKNQEDMAEAIKDALESEAAKAESVELSRALLKADNYKSTMKIVAKLDEDPELIRHGVLEYMAEVLKNNRNDQAAMILTNFWDDFYSTGKPGLVLAVYNCLIQE